MPGWRRRFILQTHVRASRRDAPEPLNEPSAQRAWGMPGAQCTRSLAREVVVECARVFTAEAPEITRHSRTRMVLRLIRALPGELSSVATVAFGLRFCPTRLCRTRLLKDLTRASRVRTTRLRRPRTPPVFARGFDPACPCRNPSSNAACRAEASAKAERETAPSSSRATCSLTESNPPCDHIARPTLPRPPHPVPRP
jgi:hypothetical protein